MRDCYCDSCNHKDKDECIVEECDCCGDITEYEHDADMESEED